MPPITFEDWTDAFNHLSLHLKDDDIVLFDEISWMGFNDITFIAKLKAWWDLQKTRFLLLLCGSVSTWIEENILQSTAFFGRIALTLTLEPLSIPLSAEFLSMLGFKGSFYEQYKLLSVVGGIPWYLEQVNAECMADENIKQLCFQKDGLLVLEFDRIFHDLFNGKGTTYKKILNAQNDGPKTLAEVRSSMRYPASGTLSQMMQHVITAGFIKAHPLWSIKEQKVRKQSLYRIADPYLRFYLKMIEPNRSKIDSGAFDEVAIATISGFDTYIGLQVENLLIQNRALLLKAMGVEPSDCVFDGPYRQNKTSRQKGCQIDYLVQTRTKNLFLCEFKFKRREVGAEIIEEVKEKMARLVIPRGIAPVPVLFHLGGVAPSVYDKNFFYRIIDIADFLD